MTSVYGSMTLEKKARIWELWRQGKPMRLIAGDIERQPSTVYSYVLYRSGIQPRTRVRRSVFLTLDEREMKSQGIASGHSLHSISRELGRSPPTFSREVSRN